jgi:hypothetical protein
MDERAREFMADLRAQAQRGPYPAVTAMVRRPSPERAHAHDDHGDRV